MNRRIAAAVFLSAVIVAVLGTIVYQARAATTDSVPVLVLSHDVAAGAPVGRADVQEISVRGTSDPFASVPSLPDGTRHAAHALHRGDILRPDDLAAAGDLVQVSLPIADAPQLEPGDFIDVYVLQGGGSVLVIGHHLPVVAGGNPMTALVPASAEAAWVSVSVSKSLLIAVKSPGGSSTSPVQMSTGCAIEQLSGIRGTACGATSTSSVLP